MQNLTLAAKYDGKNLTAPKFGGWRSNPALIPRLGDVPAELGKGNYHKRPQPENAGEFQTWKEDQSLGLRIYDLEQSMDHDLQIPSGVKRPRPAGPDPLAPSI